MKPQNGDKQLKNCLQQRGASPKHRP